jgi:predicted ATPase/DNA-binding SARP family transcriptional activator
LHRHAPQSRRYLAFLFWPDSSESQARTNLRYLLHALRQALPDADCFIHLEAQTVQWNLESPFTADVVEFEAVAAQASDSIALRRAVELYTGPLLPGCYDDWIQPERERLQERFIEVLEQLILILEQENNPRAAIHFAERLLHLDPLREGTYRQLMRLYAQRGDRLGMVRIYQTCVDVMKRELDVEVSQSTRAAYEELVQVDSAIAPVDENPVKPRRSNLPIPLSSFIGREQAMADLEQILAQRSNARPQTRLITLTGTGGCGKTRLAIETAGRLLERLQDGVWFVDLAPLSDPQLVPQAVAAVFGLQEYKGRAILQMLVGYLETRTLLLILDNCEHLLDACARLVEQLLQTCSQIQILATSRERLNLTGETVWNVPPLSIPNAQMPETLEALKRFEAVQLFAERAAAVLPTFELNRQNAASVAQVCQRLDGIPLAIELAASRARSMPVEQIAARIGERFHILTDGSRTALPRHQTLWNLIDWSYELLPEPERLLLQQLVVFSGGWTLEAAETVCADGRQGAPLTAWVVNGIGDVQILDLLTHLVDASLITYDPAESETRYHINETIREYGLERLQASGEVQQARTRHMEYFTQFAERLDPQLRSHLQLQAFNQFDCDHDNLRAALDWSLNSKDVPPDSSLRLVSAMTWFWMMKGYFVEGRSLLEHARKQYLEIKGEPSARLAQLFCDMGKLAIWEEDFTAASSAFEQSSALWQALGDAHNLAYARAYLAFLLSVKGERFQAQALWEADAEILRNLKDWWGLGWLLSWQARGARDAYDFTEAQRFYAESARLLREAGDEWSYGIEISHLGIIELNQGHYASARAMFEDRLSIGYRLKSSTHIGVAHLHLGQTAQEEGDTRQASFHYKESLRRSRHRGIGHGSIISLEGIAWTLGVQGQWREAVILYISAERFRKQLKWLIFEHRCTQSIQDELNKAFMHLGEAAFEAARAEGQALTFDQVISTIL